MQIDAVILGAAGFGGGELLRLLAQHPSIASLQAVSTSHGGQSITAAHPHLHLLDGRQFAGAADWAATGEAEHLAIFSALPHGALAQRFEQLQAELDEHCNDRQVLIIDLSGDFRLETVDDYLPAYGRPHPCPRQLGSFTYGLPELNRRRIADAGRIANPGCFATAINLALGPLAGLNDLGLLAVCGVTGSSGSGVQASAGTHHPTRAHDYRAYKTLEHQHQAEVEMLLNAAGGTGWELGFVPHSAPLVRGIFITVQLLLPTGITATELEARYTDCYRDATFVHLVDDSPRLATTLGTNHVEIRATVAGNQVAVLCALDNLGKGMAGQAVQNMNIALGLPETTGLLQPAIYP